MFKVGLTGGIGSGKSTVAELFAELGVPVLDADQIARELVEPDQPALQEIVREFGEGVLEGGHLDRTRLRALVFDDPERKLKLEAILHPRVYQVLHDRMQALEADYCLLAIPLLLETHQQAFVDRVLVVDCPVETQYARVALRDALDEAIITRIIQSQIGREQRQREADDIIDNHGNLSALHEQVVRLHATYLNLSRANCASALD